jgi:asparagine N-glycosylation enzyme membrane subunit Stt3
VPDFVEIKPWQKIVLRSLSTLIALAGAFLWFAAYGFSTCGPNEGLFFFGGIGVLALAVTALWVSTVRPRTATVPLLLFVAVAAISLYMAVGQAPGC